jgi:hypothetical protein
MKTKIHRLGKREADLIRNAISRYWLKQAVESELFPRAPAMVYVETAEILQLANR